MRKIVFIIFILFIFTSALFAGEIYTYTDKDGNTVITNTPVPEKYEKKAKKIDSYKRDSPEEIQRYQAEQKAREQSRVAETRQKQQINQVHEEAQKQNNRQQAQQQKQQKGQSGIQDLRNKEADKLEAEARKNIPGSRGMTASQRNMLINAARIRLGQEPIPYTPPPNPPSLPKGAINVETGEYYPAAAGGIINPRTGGFMPDVGGGYIDDKTGKFIPKQ